MGAFEHLWISRKCGRGMDGRYIFSAILPISVIFLITAILVFSIVFINSISMRIDRMLEILGSGSVYVYAPADGIPLPDGTEAAGTSTAEALLYSDGGERAVLVKGIPSGYFSGMRGDELGITEIDESVRNPLVISSYLASELDLEEGDRLAMMVHDAESGRARPCLATVSVIFESVYPQLDSRLVYAPLSLTGEAQGTELLLPPGGDADGLVRMLSGEGIPAVSFKTLNREAYGNVEASLSVLYLIFALIAVLAAFFSSDAAEHYASRDQSDMAELMILGAERRRIELIYLRITLLFVSSSLLLGTAVGIGLSLLSPSMVAFISRFEPAFLEYYVRSFSVSVPAGKIIGMLFLSLLVSALSIHHSLRKVSVANIFAP